MAVSPKRPAMPVAKGQAAKSARAKVGPKTKQWVKAAAKAANPPSSAARWGMAESSARKQLNTASRNASAAGKAAQREAGRAKAASAVKRSAAKANARVPVSKGRPKR